MNNKIQVGPNVWIRPNLRQSVPEIGSRYFAVKSDGEVILEAFHDSAIDYAFLNSGNFFLTREAAEQAIIKPVDPTPITYKQWVDAERPWLWVISGGKEPVSYSPSLEYETSAYFAARHHWLTREAAEAWRDQWEKENGEVK